MLFQTSGKIGSNLYLLTFGRACFYVIEELSGRLSLVDTGPPIFYPFLKKRLTSLGIAPSSLSRVYLTSDTYERVGALALLLTDHPRIEIASNDQILHSLSSYSLVESYCFQEKILGTLYPKLTPPRPLAEPLDLLMNRSSCLTLDKAEAHELSHRECSEVVSALYFPREGCIVAGKCLGFFRGNNLPAPRCSAPLVSTRDFLESFKDISFRNLAMPFDGVLSGALAMKHIRELSQTLHDVESEVAGALADGRSELEIQGFVEDQIFSDDSNDPFYRQALRHALSVTTTRLFPHHTK